MFSFVVTWFILTGCKYNAESSSEEPNNVAQLDWESVNSQWPLWQRWPIHTSWPNESAEATEISVQIGESVNNLETQEPNGSNTSSTCNYNGHISNNATSCSTEGTLSNQTDSEGSLDVDESEFDPSAPIPLAETSTPRIQSNQSRIVGGNSVQITQYPFMAQVILLKKNGLGIFCGGTLISKLHILTAGHCITESNGHLAKPKSILVRLGATNLSCGGELVPVCKVYRHPKYCPLSKKLNGAAIYDIAVLKLKKEVTFSECISPVTLATHADSDKLIRMAYTNWPCQVLGWGWTKAGVKLDTPGVENTMSKTLMATTVHLVDWTECRTIVPILEVNAELCCSSPHAASGCKGDSGGPLICEDNKEYGLVSRGTGAGCGIPNLPYIYTRIDTLHKYIADVMKSHW